MLFAAEGGGFFSSSAAGYCKGLRLLLLGQKNEEKPMRVTPWNQYQLVDKEIEPYIQLAPGKKRFVCGCASFVCFGRASAGLESPPHLKVGPTQNQEVVPQCPVVDECQDSKDLVGCFEVDDDKIVSLKSSLKKVPNSTLTASRGGYEDCGKDNGHDTPCENNDDTVWQKEQRKVQWIDATGGELFEIREFEMRFDCLLCLIDLLRHCLNYMC